MATIADLNVKLDDIDIKVVAVGNKVDILIAGGGGSEPPVATQEELDALDVRLATVATNLDAVIAK